MEEPITEDLKEEIVEDSDKAAQELIGKSVAEAQTEKDEDIPKRVSKKPTWLKDYV